MKIYFLVLIVAIALSCCKGRKEKAADGAEEFVEKLISRNTKSKIFLSTLGVNSPEELNQLTVTSTIPVIFVDKDSFGKMSEGELSSATDLTKSDHYISTYSRDGKPVSEWYIKVDSVDESVSQSAGDTCSVLNPKAPYVDLIIGGVLTRIPIGNEPYPGMVSVQDGEFLHRFFVYDYDNIRYLISTEDMMGKQGVGNVVLKKNVGYKLSYVSEMFKNMR